MILEYLADGSPDCPLINLSGFTSFEAGLLAVIAADLADGRIDQVSLHQLPWIKAVGGCHVCMWVRGWDQGVVRVGPVSFDWGFTPGTWDHVAGLVEPFAGGGEGFQWLASGPGEPAVLLSPTGEW